MKKYFGYLNVHTAYLNNLFYMNPSTQTYKKYVEIKQFSKIDMKQNYISTDILLIKEPRHLQGSCVVFIFVYMQ